jgi:hypothetical protein
MEQGAESMEHGAKSKEHGARCKEHGARSTEHGAWYSLLSYLQSKRQSFPIWIEIYKPIP